MATIFPADQVIVVGGGLAGFAAANTVLEHGGSAIMLDKSAFCGGNSTKATSGINGADTRAQRAQNIKDSVDLFQQDCLSGGAKKPEIVSVLTKNSGADVNWLVDVFNLDLSLIARLGGHSVPRTHRGKERFPGMTITYALIQMFEKVSEMRSDKARIVTKAHVTKLIQNNAGDVVGCEYTKAGQVFKEFGSVILATGGFGADFTQDSLLAKYRPDLMHLPTTNGEHCTGDGIKMGEAIGAKTIDLEWVQVHPTGLVKPEDADAKIKFLAAEALRGVGGLVLDANGKRFANELGRRDYVTGEMWKNKGPFRLVLNKAASDEIIWHCKHYTGRGVMKYYANGRDFAQDIGVPVKVLEDTHQEHYESAKKQEANPDGGPFPAYPSGKTWDEPSGKTGSGKKFFHNIIPGSQVANEPFYVAIITPVIHYCMGGLEITAESEVIGANGKRINGLYAAGEVMGGVHGNNRLGGNSLLDCVVFGRVAGRAASEYQFGQRMKKTLLADLSGGGLTGAVQASKTAGGSYEDDMNQGTTAVAVSGGAAAAVPSGALGGFTMQEVAKHNTEKDCWVVVANQVLDVTHFLKDHPGGALAILTFAGKDATEEFNMIHPPGVIDKYAPECVIGHLGGGGAVASSAGVAAAAQPALPAGQNYYSVEDVAKHATEKDCWVVVADQVLNVTSFLKDHPGGALAILTFAGRDATEEFNMIHPPGVIEKYAPECVIGRIGTSSAAPGALSNNLNAPLLAKGEKIPNEHYWGDWRDMADENPGVLYINFSAWWRSIMSMVVSFIVEIVKTIFTTGNFKFTNDRTGLTRSAIFLILFQVVHAVGNLHVYGGPDDYNGYAYFYVRLYWSGLGLDANLFEEYLLLAALLHVAVGLKRTWDISLNYKVSSGKLNLAISGVVLLVFMIIHLIQFRFAPTDVFFLRPPPYLINWGEMLRLQLFYTDDKSVPIVGVRNLYKHQLELFSGSLLTTIYYLFSTLVFVTHACLGWQKLVPAPAFSIPKAHQRRVAFMGYCIFVFLGICFFSYPIYSRLTTPKPGVCTTAASECAKPFCYGDDGFLLKNAELLKTKGCEFWARQSFTQPIYDIPLQNNPL